MRTAAGILAMLLLAGCAGGQLALGGPPEAPRAPAVNMAGHWMLATPGAPACGVNFVAAPGAKEGTVAPEGGCPGNFFMSRHWTLEKDALTITDHEYRPLAQLKLANGRFSGKSTAGAAVTLAR
jgi:hypothetical protein